jgi:hypothetical protein
MKKTKVTVLLMILGFKTDLNKYYQSGVKNKNKENQREWCAKLISVLLKKRKKRFF